MSVDQLDLLGSGGGAPPPPAPLPACAVPGCPGTVLFHSGWFRAGLCADHHLSPRARLLALGVADGGR